MWMTLFRNKEQHGLTARFHYSESSSLSVVDSAEPLSSSGSVSLSVNCMLLSTATSNLVADSGWLERRTVAPSTPRCHTRAVT